MQGFEFVSRFREEWQAREKNIKIAFLSILIVALANLAAAISMSWKYGDIAGPAGVFCGAHFYIVVIALAYFGFKMWDGDPTGWYACIVTMCAIIAIASIEGALNSPEGFIHAGIAALGLVGLLAARKQFWRHSIRV
jgi:hypothetical protein